MTNSTTGSAPAKINWNEIKDKLKVKFPTLTDADLQYEEGKKDEMLEKVQTKLGKNKEEMSKIIETI
jgi:uncharacterized protein YjbJ (UPF0337 family)